MLKVITVNKPIGIIPSEVIEKIREQYPIYSNQTLGYAGRLDPMAHGLLVILVCEENKLRKKYEILPKRYMLTILFGIQTDTFDLLGIVTSNHTVPENIKSRFFKGITSFTGKIEQPYPPYSSKPFNGKPLFFWARQNKLHTVTIPTKKITIHSISLIETKIIPKDELKEIIHKRISLVKGDFRQDKILSVWDRFFQKSNQREYQLVICNVCCSSGTYMRSLADNIGKELGTGAIAFEIKRTEVGDFTLENTLPLNFSQNT